MAAVTESSAAMGMERRDWLKVSLATISRKHELFVPTQPLDQLIETEWRIYPTLNKTITCSDNGLSPLRSLAIIWTNAGLLLIGLLGTLPVRLHSPKAR